jgi:plasmid stabilization system protein ParE
MSKPIFTTQRAQRQILEIDAWWRANREKAPNKFADELDLAFRTIETLPGAGQRYPDPTSDVHRVFLRSTRHHVYYVEEGARVLVVAVWGAVKGTGPDLRGV